MLVEVISEKTKWCSALDELGAYDFVHTFDFHKASQDNGEGTPIMFLLRDFAQRSVSSWQVLQRNISGTNYFDFTSVYGYGGPLFGKDADPKLALNLLLESMRQFGAISLFSRMHPLFIQDILDEPLKGQRLSDVVVIDVAKTDNVLTGYRDSHRREIVNSCKAGMMVTVDFDCQYLDDFLSIYKNSMQDLQASSYYYFSDQYFESMKNSDEFKILIIFAEINGKKIASSMFIVTRKIMQYYLSGTVAEFRKLAPSKAIIARAHELAITLGVDKLILGGGVGSAQDALFKFKSGFSSLKKPFYVTKKVLNEGVYNKLCAEKLITPDKTEFFPAYRA